VSQAYFDAVTSAASLTAKVRNEEIARNILASAREREAKGNASQLDTLRAVTALARATLEKNRADGNFRKTEAVLKYSIGLPATAELLLPTDLDENSGNTATNKELAAWLEATQQNHPSIVAAKKQLEAAAKQVTVARSTGLPTIDLSGSYSQGSYSGVAVSPGTSETTVTVALTIPLFEGFASTYKVRSAKAKVEKETAALTEIEEQIAIGVIKAYADARSAVQNLDASVALLKAAQSALAVSQRKYNKGAADITELLSTQAALVDAENERIRTLAEWQSARLQLLASAGRLGKSSLVNLTGNK
jgi:outer membrane protein